MSESFNAALERVKENASCAARDLVDLRSAMYADGKIDDAEVAHLLRVHRDGSMARCPEWADFFVEALVDFFALQREVPDYGVSYDVDFARAVTNVIRASSPFPGHKASNRLFPWSDVKAELAPGAVETLVAAFEAEGGLILDAVERRALARLFSRAIDYPESLKIFAMEAVYETVRADGAIDADEVALLSAVVYGPGGDANVTITRDEAEMLLALREAAAGGANAEEWPAFFAKAVGAHVLLSGMAVDVVDADEAAWLAERLGDPSRLDVAGRALVSRVSRLASRLDPAFEAFANAA